MGSKGQGNHPLSLQSSTRSSAQGNCSAKSLAASVSCQFFLVHQFFLVLLVFHQSCCLQGGSGCRGVWAGGGVGGWEGVGEGEEVRGTLHPPCHVLHYHMVLRPEGLRTINAGHAQEELAGVRRRGYRSRAQGPGGSGGCGCGAHPLITNSQSQIASMVSLLTG